MKSKVINHRYILIHVVVLYAILVVDSALCIECFIEGSTYAWQTILGSGL